MLFSRENADKVLAGIKTRTTRIAKDKTRVSGGFTAAVCPGRGKHAVCRVHVWDASLTTIGALDHLPTVDKAFHAALEGYGDYDSWRNDMARLSGNRLRPETEVVVYDFRLVEEGK